jgi:hypothetical protein
LFRRRPEVSAVPDWCAWFSPAQWEAFRKLVSDTVPVDTTGTPPRLAAEPTRAAIRVGTDVFHLDVAGVAAALRYAPQESWPAVLADYMALRPWPPYERHQIVSGGMSRIRPLLRPMISTSEQVSGGPEPVTRVLGAGLVAVLCVDGRYSPYWLWPDELRRWRADPDELWAIALHNLRREPYELTSTGHGSPWYVLSGDTVYATANLLRLDELFREPAPHGMLMVVPSRFALLFSPIRDGGALLRLKELRDIAVDLASKAGGMALSRQVLWRSADWFTAIPVADEPTRMARPGAAVGGPDAADMDVWDVQLPEALMRLLRQSGGESGAGPGGEPGAGPGGW